MEQSVAATVAPAKANALFVTNFGEQTMFKTLLTTAALLTLTAGAGFAQSSYSSSSTTTTQTMPVPPRDSIDQTTTVKRTETPNGTLVEKDTVGDETVRPGIPGQTETTHTETTTVR